MSLSRVTEIPNGDINVLFYYYKCDRCGDDIPESSPHYEDGDTHFCRECAYIEGRISEKTFLEWCGIYVRGKEGFHATYKDGKIIIWRGKRPPWKRKDRRQSKEYQEWRKAVFERDQYTCQHCGQVGGELNAHHIKPYAKFKKLRYEVSNGLTLCVECHRKVHRRGSR